MHKKMYIYLFLILIFQNVSVFTQNLNTKFVENQTELTNGYIVVLADIDTPSIKKVCYFFIVGNNQYFDSLASIETIKYEGVFLKSKNRFYDKVKEYSLYPFQRIDMTDLKDKAVNKFINKDDSLNLIGGSIINTIRRSVIFQSSCINLGIYIRIEKIRTKYVVKEFPSFEIYKINQACISNENKNMIWMGVDDLFELVPAPNCQIEPYSFIFFYDTYFFTQRYIDFFLDFKYYFIKKMLIK